MTCEEARPLLNAVLDGEIGAALAKDVEAHLGECASCSEAMNGLERVSKAVRGARGWYEAPAHLRDQVRFSLRSADDVQRRGRRFDAKFWGGAAAAVLLLSLVAAPFLVNARNGRLLVAEELLSAHERALAGRGVDVLSSDRHTVKPWFNGKLAFSPPVIDLAADGFPLEGGRIDYAGGHAVAAMVYRRRLHAIDVFVWPAGSEKMPPRHFGRDGFEEVSWTANGFVFTAVSDLNRAELEQFAGLLQAR